MPQLLVEYAGLVLLILALVLLANKLDLAYPIVLVVGGLALSFTRLFDNITIAPDIVYYVFLPPLIYETTWEVSWKELWRWRRIISSFAFPLVVLTASVVALAARAWLPGFSLALGFLLGGLVSPPDAVSASTILRRAKAPKSLLSVLEGESLLNDASSLLVVRFAQAAVLTGQFALGPAAGSFALVIGLGTALGLLVGFGFYAAHRWLPTTPRIDSVLTLLAPYCMYFAAEHFHYSGVLAVVSGGLLLSSQRRALLSYQSRLQGLGVWNVLGFVLNGLVFLLIGLELPTLVRQLGGIGLGRAIGYGLLVSLLLIVTRLLYAFGAALFTRLASRFSSVANRDPGWQQPLVAGWAGMRGVLSLVAALAIPLLTPQGQPFPHRDLILFITFVVILVTLVGQGLTLPLLIRKLHLADPYQVIPTAQQEALVQQKLARHALRAAEAEHARTWQQNEYLRNLHARLQLDLTYATRAVEQADPAGEQALAAYEHQYLPLLEQQRQLLENLNQDVHFDAELLRRYGRLLDLEEARLRQRRPGPDNPA